MQNVSDAKRLFEMIRDIPYKIPLSLADLDTTCHGKSKLLYELLKLNGFNTRLRVCSFCWSKLPLSPELKKYIMQDLEYHSYVELELDKKWIILDPSFDSGLKEKFPVNEWSETGTKFAVFPEKIFDAKDTESILAKERSEKQLEKNIKANYQLYQKLNEAYNTTRGNSTKPISEGQAIIILYDFMKNKLPDEEWYKNIEKEVNAILLYGSVAKGINKPDSDIDILIFVPLEIEEKHTTGEYFYKHKEFEINIVLRSIERLRKLAKEKNDKFQAEVFRGSEILFEKDKEVRTHILEILETL